MSSSPEERDPAGEVARLAREGGLVLPEEDVAAVEAILAGMRSLTAPLLASGIAEPARCVPFDPRWNG